MKTLVLLSALCAASLAAPSAKIHYGDPIDIIEAPFMLQFEKVFCGMVTARCGASIIGPNHVLTAGHCVNPSRPRNHRVRAGSSNLGSGTVYNVVNIVRHPQYYANDTYKTADYDIAVVTINGTFQYTDTVQPIEFTRQEPEVGSKARITGWGLTETGNPPDHLLQLNGTIISRTQCEQSFSVSGIYIQPSMICLQAAEASHAPCKGDSGGPLVVNGVQVGITSWGGSCDDVKGPATVFTNVAYVSNWIEKQIGSCN